MDLTDVGRRSMPTKGRAITSCLECYRRKQKCDRARPCNMCTSRGIPDRCQYEKLARPPVRRDTRHHETAYVRPKPDDADPGMPTETAVEGDIIDVVGYSRAMCRDQFACLSDDNGLERSMRHPSSNSTVKAPISGAYSDLLARLPPQPAVDELIRIYFSDENWSFPILDEHRFRQIYADFNKALQVAALALSSGPPFPSTSIIVPPLLFSMLAVALQFVSTTSSVANTLCLSSFDECDRVSQHYFNSGQQLINLIKPHKPSINSIEYHLSACIWFKNNGSGSEAWQSLGVAIRQAQEIDLHAIREDEVQNLGLSVEENLLQVWEIEHRKRLWARLFIMDGHMAMALGRPRTINREDCSTSLPLDCDYPSQPMQTIPLSTQHAYQPPSTMSPILYWIALSHKIHDMLSARASQADLRDNTIVPSIHQQIVNLVNEQPAALRCSYPDTRWDQQMPRLPALRERIRTATNIVLLALHRPYISTHSASRPAAIEAAFEILQAQQRLFELVFEPQRKLYGYSFYTIDAGTFLTGVILKYPNSNIVAPASALQELRLAASRLMLMRDRSPMARKGEPILQRCCRLIETRVCSQLDAHSNHSHDRGGAFDDDIASFLDDLSSAAADEPTRGLLEALANPALRKSNDMYSLEEASGTVGQDGGIAAVYLH